MNRRSFLATVIGALVAPELPIAPAVRRPLDEWRIWDDENGQCIFEVRSTTGQLVAAIKLFLTNGRTVREYRFTINSLMSIVGEGPFAARLLSMTPTELKQIAIEHPAWSTRAA